MNVNWTPRGLERLNGIVREIAFGDGISTALKWHDNIFDATEQLTDFPLSGRIVPEIDRPQGNPRTHTRALQNHLQDECRFMRRPLR